MGAIMIRRASTWGMLAVLLAAGALVWMITASTGNSFAAAHGTPPPTPPPTTPPPTNALTSDGGVSMSMAGVNCGHRSTTGEYCYVIFRAVNVSDGFPVFTEADQTAYDTSGRAFHPDPAADAVANHGKPVTQRLLRGPVVSGILVFAMPAGDRIDHVVLHGKPGTPGEIFTVPR
jgi:hypothetical protein